MENKIVRPLSVTSLVGLLILDWSTVNAGGFHSHDRSPFPDRITNASLDAFDTSINTTLSHVKLGLAAAFFFGVLIFCGLPVVIINYLQGRGSTDNETDPPYGTTNNRLNHVPNPNITNAHTEDDYPNSNHSKNYIDSNMNTNLGSSWRHPSIAHQTSMDSEQLCTPGQSPNPALLTSDQMEHRDLLTGELVAGDHTWSNPLRLPDRLRTRNPNSAEAVREKRKATNQRRLKRQLKQSVPRCQRTDRNELLQLWFSRCNCFAAGVFLSSGFMELMPDVEEAFREAKIRLQIKSEFPFASFFSLIGLFLVLSIEQIVWTCKSHEWPCCTRTTRSLNHVHSFSSSDHHSSCLEEGDGCGRQGSNREVDSQASPERLSGTRFDGSQSDSISLELSPSADSLQRQQQVQDRQSFSHPLPGSSTDQYLMDRDSSPESEHSKPKHNHHSHLPMTDDITSLGSIMRLILLLCAMSVHSLFEGLAVGLQPTSQRTIALFSAILLHKLIIAAGIGVNLATNLSHSQSNSLNKTFYYQCLGILLLASASPIGVLIGWTLIERQQSGLLLMSTAVLQALACGTFFYVVFCELLPVEFREGSKNRLGKLVFLIAGFMVVALYAYLMPE